MGWTNGIRGETPDLADDDRRSHPGILFRDVVVKELKLLEEAMGREYEGYTLESLEFMPGPKVRAKVIIDNEYSTWLHTYHDFSRSGMNLDDLTIKTIRELAFSDAALEMDEIERKIREEEENKEDA